MAESTAAPVSQLGCCLLHVEDVDACLAYYTTVLGMSVLGTAKVGVHTAARVGYLPRVEGEAELWFASCESSAVDSTTTADKDHTEFWKIGITVSDLDACVERIRGVRGGEVSDPVQFGDIGYLCHTKDPAGMVIELLQKSFKGGVDTSGFGASMGLVDPVSGVPCRATFAHISLRAYCCLDLASAKYSTAHGLALASVQAVDPPGFDLYFFAPPAFFRADGPTAPCPVTGPECKGVRAIENREWLWQRPYTMLELQYRRGEPHPEQTSKPRFRFGGILCRTVGGGHVTLPAGTLVSGVET